MVRLTSLMSLALVGALLAPSTAAESGQPTGGGRTPGSLLIYPVQYSAIGAFTFISVTNTNLLPANPISLGGSTNIKFEYVNAVHNPDDRFCPKGCQIFDKVEALTPADTLTVLTGCHNSAGFLPYYRKDSTDFGSAGYVVITAQNPYAFDQDWCFNYLAGSETVFFTSGMSYSLNAIPFQCKAGPNEPSDVNKNGLRDFDNIEYCAVADQMYLDSFLGISESYLACVNLTGGPWDTNTLHFSIWNDNERPMSITRPFKCWFNERLSHISNLFSYAYLSFTDNDPRELDVTCDRSGDVETGWAKIDSIGVRNPGGTQISDDGAFVGATSAGYSSNIEGGRLLWESVEKQTNGAFGAQ